MTDTKLSRAVSKKEFIPAIVLCAFMGWLGIHRFYLGKTGTGIMMLLTLGGLGLWVLIDLVRLDNGTLRDKDELPLQR